MYNSKEIAGRIKSMVKQRGRSLGEVLTSCELGINTVSNISKGKDILTLNFARIADCLDCSVDYLLGRIVTTETNGVEFLADEEKDLITMYRLLGSGDKEDSMELTRLKYNRTQGEKTASLYLTYTNANSNSDLENGIA